MWFVFFIFLVKLSYKWVCLIRLSVIFVSVIFFFRIGVWLYYLDIWCLRISVLLLCCNSYWNRILFVILLLLFIIFFLFYWECYRSWDGGKFCFVMDWIVLVLCLDWRWWFVLMVLFRWRYFCCVVYRCCGYFWVLFLYWVYVGCWYVDG